MLSQINLEKILFLDIETVPQVADFNELPESMKQLWMKKALHLNNHNNEPPDKLHRNAGIYAEFGKIICISSGYFREKKFRIKSFFGDDERSILSEFGQLLDTYFHKSDHLLCAHNGKEFDFPFISRRMIINNIPLPAILNTPGKKPWEVNHLDTMELWKFGDYKSFTSLNLLATILNIPTPKDDIDGSMVAHIYWKEKNIQRIVRYCQKDVVAVAQIILRFRGEQLINEQDVEIANDAEAAIQRS